MNVHRAGTNFKIMARLAEHKRLMEELMAAGMPKAQASRMAFNLVTGKLKLSKGTKADAARLNRKER